MIYLNRTFYKYISLSIYFCLTLIILSSCNNSVQESKQDLDRRIEEIRIKKEVFVKRDERKGDFLFMNFWSGMTTQEFNVIEDSLLKNKLLINYNNRVILPILTLSDRIEQDTLNFEANFKNDKLDEIELHANTEYSDHKKVCISNCGAILDLYNKKYGVCTSENLYLEESFFPKGRYHFEPFYRCIKHNWAKEDYLITMIEEYGYNQSDMFPKPSLESFSISYIDKNTFYRRIQDEKDEENKIEQSKKVIVKKSLEKI